MNSPTPLLSLCMIVRNSARTLPACLASIRPWVDEIVVVDTGSLDETRDIARRFGARVSEFTWIDDFSAARNESLRQATGDWIFWMDSDDTIDEVNGRELRSLVHGMHTEKMFGYVVQVRCPSPSVAGDDQTTVVDHVKLIRNHPQIRFEGRIHEQVLPAIRTLGGDVGWTELFVVHSGADHSSEGKRSKWERDLRILDLDLQERPDHPFVLFNLGMTHEDMGQHATAEDWLRKCLAVSNPLESHVRKAYALLVACLQQQGRVEDAVNVCSQGLQVFPGDVELQFRSAVLAHETGQLEQAVTTYRRVMSTDEPRHFASVDQGLSSYKARHNLALVLADRGEHPLSEMQWRSLLSDRPGFRPAWRGLGQSLVAQNKFTALEVALDDLRLQPGSTADLHWLAALSAERRGESEVVLPLLQRALAADAEHGPARHDYCRWLFHHGTLAEAEIALKELVVRSPEKGSALHNLGIVLSRQGKIEEAIQALEESLQMRPASSGVLKELQRLRATRQAARAGLAMSSRNDEPAGGQAQQANGTLPYCYARREIPGETKRFHCLHPKVHSRQQVVSSAMCSICSRWSEPPPEQLRPESDLVPPNRGLSCRFMGRQIGLRSCPTCAGNVQVKVFACCHPAHSETTLEGCRSCIDFSSADLSQPAS